VRGIANAGARVVVSIHVGKEGQWLPDQTTIGVIRALATAGASAVLVHHSHVFQPVFHEGSALVASGLGDCLFDLHWHDALTRSAVVTLTLKERGAAEAVLTPFRLTRSMELHLLVGHDQIHFLRDLTLRTSKLKEGRISDHGALRHLQARKLIYFLGNLLRGDSRDKLRFLARKAMRVAGQRT
jgi:hypothetical protein